MNQRILSSNKLHSEDNVCDRTLLTIVARGNAIITELNRLIDLVPPPFRYNNEEPHLVHFLDKDKRFSLDNIICDFSYFKNAESFESTIESFEVLKKADEELCDSFIDVVARFYLTFESIQRYATDLNNFVLELEEDAFVGQSLERLMLNTESRQLLIEAYFLLGFMLITTDNNFEGGLRERLIVSYYRYSSYKAAPGSNLDDTCNLMRSTGFRSAQQQIYKSSSFVQHYRPDGYPESFFGRVRVNQSIVNLLIAKLQSTDIYNQTVLAFPHPDHRSTALSQQAAMLYVILYFCPSILNSQRSRMREITDKFFSDNWVISIHMGEIVNLIELWDPYKAAKESLMQLFDDESIRNLTNHYNLKFYRASKHLQEYLQEGWLNENSILEHHTRILNELREANVILRWLLLHSQFQTGWQSRLSKSFHSIITENQPNRTKLYLFLQNLSELEKRFLALCKKILKEKDGKIREQQTKATETLIELVEIFSGTRPMRWVRGDANSKLAVLLNNLTTNLKSLDLEQTNSRDSIINLINDIEAKQDSYSDGKNLQVVQLFADTRDSLLMMLRYLSMTDDIEMVLTSISDFSYAWQIMDVSFTSHMQHIIKDDPLKVYGVESAFLKLSSAFDTCLIRIQQVNSREDLISVSQYYSTKLVSYIRDVLHIIPATILELLSSLISIQTEYIISDNMSSKVPLDNLKDYALPEKRFQMLELTYKISHYAESMLMMRDTTIGLFRINPKQMLEDGVRRELVRRMSDSIHEILIDEPSKVTNNSSSLNHQKAQNLLNKLTKLDLVMNGYKRSFEYIQDYIFIYGLRMWQEELDRIIKFNVEQATDALMNETSTSSSDNYRSTLDKQHSSLYQSTKAPIPTYSSNPLRSSFIVRILEELLSITDPRSTIYDEQMSAWYEQKSQRGKVIDLKVFELMATSLCVTGLNGFDQMCSSLLLLELQKLDKLLITMYTSSSPQSRAFVQVLTPVSRLRQSVADSRHTVEATNISTNANDFCKQSVRTFSNALQKLAPFSEKIIEGLLRIGQLQAIRTNISCVLSTKCRYEARSLYSCLETLNTTMLTTLQQGAKAKIRESISQHKNNDSVKTGLICMDQLANKASSSNQDEAISRAQEVNCAMLDCADDLSLRLTNTSESNSNLEDSQLIFELTNHLDWIGLSDPMGKIYSLQLQTSSNSEIYKFRELHVAMDIMFLVLLDQSSKFHFSRSISGFVPKQSRTFYETTHTVDAQPLFYGLITLINHYQPYITAPASQMNTIDQSRPLISLLECMSLYVKCSLSNSFNNPNYFRKPRDLKLEDTNMILSIIELIRLAREPSHELLAKAYLPEFLFNTFQFTMYRATNGSNK